MFARATSALWDSVELLLPSLPKGPRADLLQLIRDSRDMAQFSIQSAMDTTDSVGRAMASSVALRLHAWLCDGSFPENVREQLRDLPFDGAHLFDEHADSAVQRLFSGFH